MTPDRARSVIRVSIGVTTTESEIDGFATELREAIERLRAGALV
jgi:cysteine sulfinate desulfinase/cysteine desulfurase-like protein